MIKYRISKYNPKYRDNGWLRLEDTWTSFSDIGKIYKGKELIIDEYLKVENKYIEVILDILTYFNIDYLRIEKLELRYSSLEIKKAMKDKGIIILQFEEEIIESLLKTKTLKLEHTPIYIKFILRECFWCELYSDIPTVLIEFGYDFYMYVTCPFIPKEIIDIFKSKGIFIDIF